MAALKVSFSRQLPGPWLFSDSTVYGGQATAIATRGWEALRAGAQDYTILYPLMISPAFALPSRAEAHQAALAINAVVSTSALFPLYWIARRMLPAKVAAPLVAVVALLPSSFTYALALSAENLFQPLFWWGTFFLLRLSELDERGDAAAAAAGLCIGLLPAVKLTGFGVLAAGALLAVGMAVFHRVDGRRAAVFLVALVLPQIAWVFTRVALGDPGRGLFGFGPGVGESLVAGLARIGADGWSTAARYFLDETTYFMTGAYVAWLAFSVYLVTQYRTWESRSSAGFLLLWTFLAAAALALVTVLFLFPIARNLTDPDQRGREIYGRFIEVLFPALFILGTRGMIDFAWKERAPRAPRRELFLLLATAIFTGMSFYPLTGYAVASPLRAYAFEWLGRRLSVGVLLAIVLLPAAAAVGWFLLRREGGLRPALVLALVGVLGVHALVFGVTIGGVVRGAQVRDATLFRIGHWLDRHGGPGEVVAYDEALRYGDQWFAYRFWSQARWEVVSSSDLPRVNAAYLVTRRPLPLPVLEREANGVRLYRGPETSRPGERRAG